MENKNNNPKLNIEKEVQSDFPGYPHYPPSEDIYENDFEEEDINLEDTSEKKTPIEIDNRNPLNEKDFEDDVSGGNLDIPGSELDDEQENIGSEDEENNGYSIGGDNHNNLEENIQK